MGVGLAAPYSELLERIFTLSGEHRGLILSGGEKSVPVWKKMLEITQMKARYHKWLPVLNRLALES